MLRIYDKQISELNNLLNSKEAKTSSFDSENILDLLEREELILRSDTAIELGNDNSYAISSILFTTDINVPNSIEIIGQDIQELIKNKNCTKSNYSRIVIVKLKADAVENKSSQQLYGIFRKLEYLRFNLFIKGLSFRISSIQNKEAVRISNDLIKKNVSFTQIGNTLINEYLKFPEVEAVKIIFISNTNTEFNKIFEKIKTIANQVNNITDSLNEIFKGLKMDCSVCAQKQLCEEIDGLRELHGNIG